MSQKFRPRFGKFIVFGLVGFALLGALVMLLWNWLIPTLFVGAHSIEYVQALGLLALCKILFGGFRRPNHFGPGFGRHAGPIANMSSMSDEERERFQAGMKQWKCRHHAGGDKSEITKTNQPTAQEAH